MGPGGGQAQDRRYIVQPQGIFLPGHEQPDQGQRRGGLGRPRRLVRARTGQGGGHGGGASPQAGERRVQQRPDIGIAAAAGGAQAGHLVHQHAHRRRARYHQQPRLRGGGRLRPAEQDGQRHHGQHDAAQAGQADQGGRRVRHAGAGRHAGHLGHLEGGHRQRLAAGAEAEMKLGCVHAVSSG